MSKEIYKAGEVVGITDQEYNIEGSTVVFNDVLVKGDMSGEIEYNGNKLRVVRINQQIGMEVGAQGPRGPVMKGVECELIT